MSAPNGQGTNSATGAGLSSNLPPVAPSNNGAANAKDSNKERGANLTIAITQDRDSHSDRQSAPATPASPASSTTSSASTISTRDISDVKEPPPPILPVDENGVPILFQTALYEGHVVEYEEISVPPLYEGDPSKGSIRLKVPKEYMQYKPSPGYVGSSNVVFLNFQDVSFYEKAATLPNPILTVWVLCPHKTFNKTESGNSYVKKRIVEEAYRQNIQVKAVNPDKFDLQVSKHGYGTMVYEGQQLPLPDCAISRVGAAVGYFGLAVLRQLESLSVTVFNDVRSIEVSRDKLYTHQVLAGNGVPIPKTVLGKFPIEYDFIQRHFGYPVILKRTSGSKGDQVWKLDSKEQLQELEMRVEDKDKPYIFQEYLAHTKGRDIRAFVIGDRVSATMMRVAAKGQFKANVHQGGTVRPTKLKKPLQAMVLKTAKLCGLEYAGVDVLLDKDGYKICEVNSSPGFEGLERASGVNVAKDLVDYVRAKMEVLGKTRKEIVEDIVPIQEDHLRLGTELAEAATVSVTAASVGDPTAPSAAVSLFNVPPPGSQTHQL